jgi:hypothetical protein
MVAILLELSVSAFPRHAPAGNTPELLTGFLLVPSLEQSMILPVEFGLGFIREGDSIASAANIVPQNGTPRPETETATVSYQITHILLMGISGGKLLAINCDQIL